jgi:outer membrane protein assembly factor BamB
MKTHTAAAPRFVLIVLATGLGLGAAHGSAADWPQWRGAHRDGKAADFTAPKTWPQALTQKWKVTVGRGDATPALVSDRLFVFARDEAGELTLCLDAATGKEIWRDHYDALAAAEPMGRHPGPRSSPTVAAGKVITCGARGTLSCLESSTGKVVWRKDQSGGTWPRFFTASSPLVTDSLCVAQLGSEEKGGLLAFDLANGNRKWQWTEDGTAYASPVLLTVGGTKMVVALTAKKIVGLRLADGELLWEAPFAPANRAYNAATPIVDGTTVIYDGAGRGAKAVSIQKSGDGYAAQERWSNPDHGVQFNTPVLKGRQIYGLAQNGTLFCLDAQNGQTLWTAPLGGRDFGSIVDAGSVLLALTPPGELVVFEPSDKEYRKLASYKVATTDTYAHPVAAGNRIYVKDQNSVTLWTVD